MKKILGLDLGTNSIGWSLIEHSAQERTGRIIGMGSRIIPMSQDVLSDFDKGNSKSQTAERTRLRSVRRLRERHLLRRERLHRVLNVLGFLPEHYAQMIDFQRRKGKFQAEVEVKLPFSTDENGNFKFLFLDSYMEMIAELQQTQPQLFFQKSNGDTSKVPYDWTIYYLRKKALREKISKEELAWIILNFNQKRGYYQLRVEDEDENPNKLIEFYALKVTDVIADSVTNPKGETWYSLHLENGWIYRRSSKIPLDDLKNKVKEFIVTTDINEDGSVKVDKEGVEIRSFRAPNENDWTLIKKKTEADIDRSCKTVGEYIYEHLLTSPFEKIKGKLVRTIERKYYRYELEQLLSKQVALQPELFSSDVYTACVLELYASNEGHQMNLSKRNFVHLFVNDIIFYQRPLRSQKSNISNCALESRTYKNEGEICVEPLKATSKSHPLYQEFRVWQWISNLKIYVRDSDRDVTFDLLSTGHQLESLFNFLNSKRDIDQKGLLKFLKLSEKQYRWNYVEDKSYPCNETKALIEQKLLKVVGVPSGFLTAPRLLRLWHIIYSVNDKLEFEKALAKFAEKEALNVISFVESFKKIPPFKSDYGTYSEKALKKLLPLMRLGETWSWDNIDANTKVRIGKLLSGEYDELMRDKVREMSIHLTANEHFQGLPLWLAQYVVYDRHSEATSLNRWDTVGDLKDFLDNFKQHSLRNPIVEQVITETLRVVKDIWQYYGKGTMGFFDEIHVELGREMKNTAGDRKKITDKVVENENTNLRIKAMLIEMVNSAEIDNVRPYSPSQQELLKIYEEGVINSGVEIPDDIAKIIKAAQPSTSDLHRYRLWLEQKYRSPYTGAIIPLGKLFTPAYEIEHIIPQSRYFDDSLSNKVICEAAVNKLKDRQLGLEFIRKHHGQIVSTGFGATVTIFDEPAYQKFVNDYYDKNRAKKIKLLLDEIPDKMIERQMNDTRYISKFIMSLLSNLVRDSVNDEGVNSKHVVPVYGKITTELKKDWGLNDVWNELILPRFERMNQLTGTTNFTSWSDQQQKFIPTVPLALSKGFQKKRIDHRHHAMDALVIACATRDHVNLLNNLHANSDKQRYDLQRKLKRYELSTYQDSNTGKTIERAIPRDFYKPWDNFTLDAKRSLENIVISFKQNQRIINRTSNKFEQYVEKNGSLSKQLVSQNAGDSWAIRKPLHKDTVFGKVSLRRIKQVRLSEALKDRKSIVDKALKFEIQSLIQNGIVADNAESLLKYFKSNKYLLNGVDVSKVEVYYFDHEVAAVRKPLDSSFNEKKILEQITDTGIQKILLNHLFSKDNNPEAAFSPEGIEEMNKDISSFNDGRNHRPIRFVRVYEPIGNKFQIGSGAHMRQKYVEAAKGTNLFFGIYVDEDNKRSFDTIPLHLVIERLKQGLGPVPELNEKGHRLLFHLSPNDLVYVPDGEENVMGITIEGCDKNRIYKMVSCTGRVCHFVQQIVANYIENKVEFSSKNKMEKSIEGVMIKDVCVNLKINRLGIIEEAHL